MSELIGFRDVFFIFFLLTNASFLNPNDLSEHLNQLQFSLNTFQKKLLSLKKSLEDLKQILEERVQIDTLKEFNRFAYSEKTKLVWDNLIEQALSNLQKNKNIQFLTSYTTLLMTLDVPDLFMMTLIDGEDVTVERLMIEYEEIKDFLEKLINIYQTIDDISNADLLDKDEFENSWNKFRSIVDYCAGSDFLDNIMKNRTSKVVFVGILKKISFLFDFFFGFLRDSDDYDFEDRASSCRFLLKNYGNLIISYRGLCVGDHLDLHIQEKVDYVGQLENVFKEIESLFLDEKEALFLGSSLFFPDIAMLGSNIRLTFNKPRTYQDIFSFIDKSFLNLIKSFSKNRIIISDESLPSLFISFVTMMQKAFLGSNDNEPQQVFFVGTEVTSNNISFVYNHHLTKHGGTISISLSKNQEELEFSFLLFEGNEFARLDRLCDFVQAASIFHNLDVSVQVENQKILLSWKCSESDKLEEQQNQITGIIRFIATSFSNSLVGVEQAQNMENDAYNKYFKDIVKEDSTRLLKGLIDISLTKKDRIHSYIITMLNQGFLSGDDPEGEKYIHKLLDIIEKLCDEKNREYGIRTELFEFKRVHSPRNSGINNKDLGNFYNNLEPTVQGFYQNILGLEADLYWINEKGEAFKGKHFLSDFYRETARALFLYIKKYKNLTSEHTLRLEFLDDRTKKVYWKYYPSNFSWIDNKKRVGGMARPNLLSQIHYLKKVNVGTIISLTETPLEEHLIDKAIKYIHLPVEDFSPPSQKQILLAVKAIEDTYKKGKATVVHCLGGKGRTGTILAAFLVKYGGFSSTDDTINSLRKLRPGSVETQEQVQAIEKYRKYLKKRKSSE